MISRTILGSSRSLAMAGTLALLGLVSPARATFLAPGASVTPDANATLGTQLSQLTDTFNTPLNGSGADIGTLIVTAYRSTTAVISGGTTFAAGDITFTYQLFVDPASRTSITSVTAADFAPGTPGMSALVDVSAFSSGTPANQTTPLSVFRGAFDGGHVITFDFNSAGHEIAPGSASQVLVVRTNATNYTLGTATVQGGAATTLAGYQPVSVPEPASVAMLGLGLAGALGAYRVRNRRKSA